VELHRGLDPNRDGVAGNRLKSQAPEVLLGRGGEEVEIDDAFPGCASENSLDQCGADPSIPGVRDHDHGTQQTGNAVAFQARRTNYSTTLLGDDKAAEVFG
jgi:hypothetical protein